MGRAKRRHRPFRPLERGAAAAANEDEDDEDDDDEDEDEDDDDDDNDSMTDSRPLLLFVASALFISPMLPWTLRSSILAHGTLQHRPARPFVRANLAERVLPSPTCYDTRPSRRRSFKRLPRRRQPRGRPPPHHRRPQHGTSHTPRSAAAAERNITFPRTQNRTSAANGVDDDH